MDKQYIDNKVYFDIPRLIGAVPAPVSVIGATLERRESAPSVIEFIIHRELNIPIKSFTLSYSFSPPSAAADGNHFTEREYNGSVLNEKESMIIRGSVPAYMNITGGCVFVSRIILESGTVITYKPKVYLEADALPDDEYLVSQGDMNDGMYERELSETSKRIANEFNSDKKQKSRKRKIAIAAVIIISLAIYAAVGLYLFFYNRSVKNVANELIDEGRYNEAYKIVSDSLFDNSDTVQLICESAVEDYLAVGDYHSAFVYAKAAPEPFEASVIEAAKNALLTYEPGGEIDDNAFGVVRRIESSDELDTVIASLVDICHKGNEYLLAMDLAYEIASDEKRDNILSELFTDGVKYYMSIGMFEDATAYIDKYAYSKSVAGELAKYCESVGIDLTMLIEDCEAKAGSANAIILADYLSQDSSSIIIKNEDPSIRQNLTAYELMSADQKREYHAQRFALYKEAFYIKDGKLNGTDITNAVSVDANEYQTVVLLSDGTVTSIDDGHNMAITIPEGGNTVQIAAGQSHVVLLDDDGTVSAYGSNDSGQCDTAEWTDIVAVAAGANFTLGLRSNGELVACGSDLCDQCDVSEYKNVADIDACGQTAVILFNDGSIALQGDVSMGLREAEKFENVTRMSAGDACIVAETSDGRYLIAQGTVLGNCGSVDDWQNVEMFAAGSVCIGYVDGSGTVKLTGDGAPHFEET